MSRKVMQSPEWSSEIVRKLEDVSKMKLPKGQTFLYVESNVEGDCLHGLRVAGMGDSANLGVVLGQSFEEIGPKKAALILKNIVDTVSLETMLEFASLFCKG